MNQIGYDGRLAKNSLRGIKAFASGLFKEAERLGYFNGPNPVRDVRVPDRQEPEETYAYTLEEIADILSRLPETSSHDICHCRVHGTAAWRDRRLAVA